MQLYYPPNIVVGTIYNQSGYRKSILQPKSFSIKDDLGIYLTSNTFFACLNYQMPLVYIAMAQYHLIMVGVYFH